MTDIKYDVLAVGSAIVDVLAEVEDDFITAQSLEKGNMQLIFETEDADRLYDAMPAGKTEASGGSAANTIAGVGMLGGKGAFIGRRRNDALGDSFAKGMADIGVAFSTPAATDGPATARCLIAVTPDAERTMSTYLGAAAALTPDDIDEAEIAKAQVTYVEGYLWDADLAKQAVIKAVDAARAAGRKTALTLSDGFCVDRHRDTFKTLIKDKIDIVFANEEELLSLMESDDFESAAHALQDMTETVIITRSEQGAYLKNNDGEVYVPVVPIKELKDTTGAGDLFAAGVLFGLTNGRDLETSGRLGALAASEVIQMIGPRPTSDLKALAAEHGL